MLTALEAGNPSAVSFFRFQAFTTAVVQDQRIRENLKNAIDENLAKGEGHREFKKLVDDIFNQAGLTHLHNYQINNIYETNVSLAFGAGQMQKMLEVSDEFPYWKYSATLDSKTRPSHAALHGKIFKAGDYTFFPPIGFRCRCTAIPLTARQAARYLKTDMPDSNEKNKLYDLLESKEFAGNKQQKFMDWITEQYKNADTETLKLLDQAFDTMRQEIRNHRDDKPTFLPKELLEDSEYLKNTGIKFKEEFFRMIDRENPVKLIIEKKGKGSYYNPQDKTIHITDSKRNQNSQWHRESVIYHEFGHAIDWQRDLRNSAEIHKLMEHWQKKLMQPNAEGQPFIALLYKKIDSIGWRVSDMKNSIFKHLGITKDDVLEQICATMDTIKALTLTYGHGHTTAYFQQPGFREAEFIAHCFENKFIGNRIFQKYLPELYNAMCQFIDNQQKG